MIDEPEARRFAGRPASVHCWRPGSGRWLTPLGPDIGQVGARERTHRPLAETTDDMIADLIAGGLSWRLAFWCY